eukprot:3707-Heterococcus_DN1.PRE.6
MHTNQCGRVPYTLSRAASPPEACGATACRCTVQPRSVSHFSKKAAIGCSYLKHAKKKSKHKQ